MASTDDKCHFFRLPLELRDEIYDMAAVDEEHLAIRIDLPTSQESEPKITAYCTTGLSRASSEVRREYAVALRRRVKSILTRSAESHNKDSHTSDSAKSIPQPAEPDSAMQGAFLLQPIAWLIDPEGVSSNLHVSQNPTKRGHVLQKTHAFTISIPYRFKIDRSRGTIWHMAHEQI